MRVNLDLSPIQATDTIIVANNRQALAIKRSLGNASKMPKVFSYQSWLERFWRSNNLNQDNRFLTQLEFRFLLKEFIKDASVKNPETFIEELIKCYKLCKSYRIEIDKISKRYIFSLARLRLGHTLNDLGSGGGGGGSGAKK